MLLPNNKQKTKLFQYAGTARFAYNWALAREEENYRQGGGFINDTVLRKEFTKLKQQKEYQWLNSIDCNVAKQAVKDACAAYRKFFNKSAGHPKFKSKKRSAPKFYQDTEKIQFNKTHVKVTGFACSRKSNKQKLNWIRLAEHDRIPVNSKYLNPRIKFDGLNWYLTVGVECEAATDKPLNTGIGIDLGIKDLAICSDGNRYANINKLQKIKKLEKRKRRLQHCISNKYNKNKKGECYCKTSNIIKSEKELLKVNHRLTNIRLNNLHQITSSIIKRKPSFIVLEDLNVNGMLKNRHLSKAIQQQCFYEFRRQVEYKSEYNNIRVIVADRFFPSSKLCYCCGNVKKDLKLSDRVYKCKCGNIIDRDYQAALNLRTYGENVLLT